MVTMSPGKPAPLSSADGTDVPIRIRYPTMSRLESFVSGEDLMWGA